MLSYIARRLLLIPVTMLGIMAVNFFIIQFAPGGPVETLIARLEGVEMDLSNRFVPTGSESDSGLQESEPEFGKTIMDRADLQGYLGTMGLDEVTLQKSFKCFDFTQSAGEMFVNMVWDYVRFDFCESFFRDDPVFTIIGEALPVSISLGVFGFIFTFAICLPLGIWKSQRDGSRADTWSTSALITIDALPSFLIAIVLLAFFAGNLGWFPIGGLTSRGWEDFPLWRQIIDYLHHITLPVIVILIGGYAGLTMFVKNSYLDQLRQPYVTTARAKGLSEWKVMQDHVFRNAMILIIASLPGTIFGLFFTSSILIEEIYSLPGLGRLGLDALARRDFPIMFATTFVIGLISLVLHLVSDIVYTIVDPRVDFEGR